MCGFLVSSLPEEKHRNAHALRFDKASNFIASRGPDTTRYFNTDEFSGVNHQLNFVGLNPKPLPKVTASYVLFFEGEIYNWEEVAEEIGFEIKNSSTDYDLFGDYFDKHKNLDQLEGMFAFVFWQDGK